MRLSFLVNRPANPYDKQRNLTLLQSGRVKGFELSGEKNKVQDADLTAMNSCKRK